MSSDNKKNTNKKNTSDNKMELKFLSYSQNESFARSVAGLFSLQLNPSVAQLSDIKTAVSEAVTNCIVHG